MKPSAPSRLVAIGVVLALTTTACGFFSVPNEVGLKRVSVDLTFGAEIDPIPSFSVPPAPPPVVIPPPAFKAACEDGIDNDEDGFIDFPFDPGCDSLDDQSEVDPPPPLCGPTTAVAPEEATVASQEFPRDLPEDGPYLFNFLGNFQDEAFYEAFAHREISNGGPEGDGFSFTISNPVTNWEIDFESRPISEVNPEDGGLYLAGMRLPADHTQASPRLLSFEPATPLKLLHFPVQSGQSEENSAIDVAPKSTTPITNPVTNQPILSPSGNAISSRMDVFSPETVIVCEELALGFKANWDLEITGEYNVRIIGTFWLATQFGGFDIRADYVAIGDLIAGNHIHNLAKIDPGDYI